MDQLVVVRVSQLNSLDAAIFLLLHDMLLTNNSEMRLMSQQGQHDEIGVRSIETVSSIWIIIFVKSQLPNEIEHFVLAFTWHLAVRHHNFEFLVEWVHRQLVFDKVGQLPAQLHHERSAR